MRQGTDDERWNERMNRRKSKKGATKTESRTDTQQNAALPQIFFEYNLLLNRDTFFDFRIFLKKSEHFSSQFRGGFLRRFHTFCIWFFYTLFRTYIFWFLGIPSHLFFLPAKGHLKKWFTASRRILSEGHFFAQLFTDLYFSQCFPKAIFVWQFFSVFLNSQIFV